MAYSNEEALYLFIDGELEPTAEEALFAELAYNEQLRSEMKDLLFMRNAARRDDLAAPLFVKDKLIAAVGLATTVAASGGGAGFIALSETAQKMAPWWESLWVKIATPLLAAITSAFVMWTLNNKPSNSSSIASTPPPATAVQKEKISTSGFPLSFVQSSTPVAEKEQEAHTTVTYSSSSTLLQHYQAVMLRNAQLETRLRQEIALREAADSAVRRYVSADTALREGWTRDNTATHEANASWEHETRIPIYPTPLLYADKQILVLNASPVYLSAKDNNLSRDLSGHTVLRLRGINSQSLTATALEPQSSSIVDNVHIAGMYNLTSGLALGVEVGRDAFVQNFHGKINNRLSKIEQYPELWNVGIIASYHLWDVALLHNTELIGESFIGGAVNGGPLGRQLLGVRYGVSENISLMGGIQFSSMLFQFQNEWFSTFKYGVTYGIQYNF